MSSSLSTFLAVVLLASPIAVVAQSSIASAAPVSANEKPMTFDVISIRENTTTSQSGPPANGPTASGYRSERMPIAFALITAYVPSGGASDFFSPFDVLNMPDWMTRTRYDIDARVSATDMERWQKPDQQPEMLRAMLQQMLAERFKLVVHRETRERQVYNLVAAKGGPKLTPSADQNLDKIREKHPQSGNLPGGMILVEGEKRGEVKVYNATMTSFGILVTKLAGRPIVDKTGLTGRYDITLDIDMSPPVDGGPAPDPTSILITALQEQLGLRLEPAKSSVEVLVVDHVEKPTDN